MTIAERQKAFRLRRAKRDQFRCEFYLTAEEKKYVRTFIKSLRFYAN